MVKAYEIVFSDNVTSDFTKGGIDVPGILRQDWLTVPVQGSCGLAGKFATAHKLNNLGISGTLQTTFEYITNDCSAQYNRDNNSCSLLYTAFSVCLGFPSDSRMTQRLWGFCTNYNFRVSYMWVTNATTTMAKTDLRTTMSLSSPKHLQSSSRDWDTSTVWTGFGLGTPPSNPTDPLALAEIYQDFSTLNRIVAQRSTIGVTTATGGRLDTGCNWRFSNIMPVAWDGIQNTLLAGQTLQSVDTEYCLAMQTDCNLVLYKKGPDGKYEWNALWATFSNFNDPFQRKCYLELQPSGNLVVRDPDGNPRWTSGRTTSMLYSCALTVLMNGNVVVYEMISGSIVWATNTGTP